MFAVKPPAGLKRWPRGQKFALSPVGHVAESGYRDAVVSARASGRSALESTIAAWASPLGVHPGDGVILSELRAGQLGVADLCHRLESADISPDEVRSALGRLVEAGVVAALPLASQLVYP